MLCYVGVMLCYVGVMLCYVGVMLCYVVLCWCYVGSSIHFINLPGSFFFIDFDLFLAEHLTVN